MAANEFIQNSGDGSSLANGPIGGSEVRRPRLAIIMPVFNDWKSFSCLLGALEQELEHAGYDVSIFAVDDCSTDQMPVGFSLRGVVSRLEVARLGMNVGHQRAIAVGLVHIATRNDVDFVAVMDSDGEDRPKELRLLMEAASLNRNDAIVAERKKRSEGVTFKLFYRAYKELFVVLTGQRIAFGNFSVLTFRTVQRLVHNPHIWNNFAATLMQSRLNILYVPTTRGHRYCGSSKMNFVSLITHGLGAISVFSESVFVRILIISFVLLVASALCATAVIGIRLFTYIAIPGWATNVLGFTFLLSFQAVMLPIMVGFLLLNNRASIQSLPKDNAARLIDSIHLFAAPERGEVEPL